MVRIVTRLVTKKTEYTKKHHNTQKRKEKQCILHNKVECPVFLCNKFRLYGTETRNRKKY